MGRRGGADTGEGVGPARWHFLLFRKFLQSRMPAFRTGLIWVCVTGAILPGVQHSPHSWALRFQCGSGAVPVTARSFSPLGSSRFRAVSLFGDLDHAEAEHVLHGPAAGEGGLRDVLPGCGAVPQLLLALPHRLLSL